MARIKKKKKEIKQLLINLGSLIIVGFSWYVYYKSNSLIAGAITFGILIGIALVIRSVIDAKAQERLRRSGIKDIDQIDGRQFEHYLGLVFKSQGYKVGLLEQSVIMGQTW